MPLPHSHRRPKMKYIYTATFTPNENGTKYYCRVPDLPGCITTGDTLEDAISMITDAVSGWLVVAEDEGNHIPNPSTQDELDVPCGTFCSLICVDTLAYRAATDTKATRKNVSLPLWMANLADKRGINCSKLLQDALLSALS